MNGLVFVQNKEQKEEIFQYRVPPRLCWSSAVILESRYGICFFDFLQPSPALDSDKAVMTFLKANREVFICLASFKVEPVAPVRLTLSLPVSFTNITYYVHVLI